MQLLPQHRRGRLSGSVVGLSLSAVMFIEAPHYSKTPRAHSVQAAPVWEEPQCLHLARRDPLNSVTCCTPSNRSVFVLFTLSLSAFVSHRHTLPASQWEKAGGKSPEWYWETLGDGRPVIIYLHGNVGTRWDERSSIEILQLILIESSGCYMTSKSKNNAHGGSE